MDWYIQAQNLIVIPMLVNTLIQMVKCRKELWDNQLTAKDRILLFQITIFLLLPIVVLVHELGHAIFIYAFGGKVIAFQYGLIWGSVTPSGNFTALQNLIISSAGVGVQVLVGLLTLLPAFISTSPPVVALSVYLSLWSIVEAIIFYPMLSLVGTYGDWLAIYNSTETGWVRVILVIHLIGAALLIWAIYGEKPRLWFARRTNPEMIDEEDALLRALKTQNSTSNILRLAWLYYRYGADQQCKKYVQRVEELDPEDPEHFILKGALALKARDLQRAIAFFKQAIALPRATDLTIARAYMLIGSCEGTRATQLHQLHDCQSPAWKAAVEAYGQAISAKPDLADPLYYRATLFNKAFLYNQAESDLRKMSGLSALDANLFELAVIELKRALKGQEQQQ